MTIEVKHLILLNELIIETSKLVIKCRPDMEADLLERIQLLKDILFACEREANVLRLHTNNMIEIPIEDNE